MKLGTTDHKWLATTGGCISQLLVEVTPPQRMPDLRVKVGLLSSGTENWKRLAFRFWQREDDSKVGPRNGQTMLQPGQLVRVNLAGLQAEGVMFQAAVTDAVAHIVKQTSEQPAKYVVKLLFSFRGVSEVEVAADRIHAQCTEVSDRGVQ